MRRVIRLVLLIGLLAAVVFLNRLTADWHYVLPVQPGALAYVATFDGLIEDWTVYQGRVAARIMDGVLRLDVDDVNSAPFSTARPYFGDFDLRVQATPVDGPENNGYGVIFRVQNKDNASPSDDSYYWFMISSDGYYQVVRVLNGEQKELSTWIPSPHIQQGIGVTNGLRVTARGDSFRFAINGQPVELCIPDDPNARSTYNEVQGRCLAGAMKAELVDASIPTGRLGLIAQSFDQRGVVVDFDNVIVLGPDVKEQ